MFSLLLAGGAGSALNAQSDAAGREAKEAESDRPAGEPADGEAAEEAEDPPAAGETARTSLNLLGEVDAESGEGRRNENVRITLIDNNVLKEINLRMGTTATLVKELRVERGYFGAEFGGKARQPPFAVPNRSRTFHGNLYWSHENSVLAARSFFQVGEVLPAHNNDYGFTVSLPAWRGGVLTLNGSQTRRRGNVNGNVLVPRADERTPLTTDPGDRAFVERILAAYPAELPNRTDIDPRALNTNDTQKIDNNLGGVILDQRFGPRDTISLGYRFTGQKVEAFQLVGGQNPDTTTKNHAASLTWTRAWSPATTTDFHFGFDRVGSLLVPDETSVGPLILTGFVIESLGPTSIIPIDRAVNRFRYAGRVQTVRGAHIVTAGFELVRRQVNGFEAQSHRGVFSFSNNFGRDAITNIRMGTPSSFRIALGNAHRGFRDWNMQFYIGDRWRLHPKLTLDLGLRYEPVTAPYEVNRLTPIAYSCDCNNWAPRFGLAFRPGGAWGTVRLHYGISYGQIFPVTFSQARFNPPLNLNVALQDPKLSDPLGGLGDEDLDPTGRSLIFELDKNLVTPYAHLYGLTWELGLFRDWRLSLGYVGSRAHKLLTTWFTNRARPVEGIEQTTGTVNLRRPDPRFFEVRRVLNGSRGYFDAAKAELTLPRWGGLTLNASYWFSKAIDLGGAYTSTGAGRDARRGRSQSEFNVFGEMRALSSFDQTHAFLARLNYETPALIGRPRLLRGVLGGWQVNSVILLKSGTPFNIISGSDGPGFGNVDGAQEDRPNILAPSILGRTIDNPDTSRERLPAAAFSFIGPTETAGSLGRNVFRKDGVWNVNLGLSRRWTLHSERTLLFRVESLNFLNSPQFAAPGFQLTSPNFGSITNTLNDGRTFRFRLQLNW